MPFSPDLERDLRQSVRQARLVAFTCCYVAPAMYLLTLGSQVLGGRWGRFLIGFDRLPWGDHRVSASIAAACMALALSLVLPPRLGRMSDPRTALGALRARNLLASALLAAMAVCGLFLGVKLGPPAASLSLVLCLAPMARAAFVLPTEGRWRATMAQFNPYA